MSDQADGLRQLVQARSGATALADPPEPCPSLEAAVETGTRSLVLTSGKGGVGTSNLTLNLAIALAECGQRVVLVDADLGLANIDLLCGLAPAYDLGDVLAGDCTLAEAVMSGPLPDAGSDGGALRIVPGAHGMRTLLDVLGDGPSRLVAELAELEAGADFLLIDAGSGLGPGIATLAAAAEQLVIVTTPEPTSVADAHAVIGRFRRLSGPSRLRTVVNQAASPAEAIDVQARLRASSRQFLGTVVEGLGYVRYDAHVPQAVRLRQPFLLAYPGSVASRGVRRLARDLIEERRPRSQRPGFFSALAARWALSRVAR